MKNIPKIIFDTDIGCDCDDVIALCLLCAAHNRGECELAAVTCSLPYESAARCSAAILAEYGLESVPVYGMKGDAGSYYREGSDVYAAKVAERFAELADRGNYIDEDPVKGLRKLLASGDRFVIAATGPVYNIGRLLESKPDDVSPLDGVSLVAEKVELLALMYGNFSHLGTADAPIPEWNVKLDIPASKATAELSPVKTVILPFEAGLDMITGAENTAKYGDTRPSSYAFLCHGSANGRHSWDPATVLYAVYGASEWFDDGKGGKVSVNNEGGTDFVEDSDGNCYVLTLKQTKTEIASVIDRLIINER